MDKATQELVDFLAKFPAPTPLKAEVTYTAPNNMFEARSTRWKDHASDETYLRTGIYMGYPGAVVVLPLTEDGKILFSVQFRPVAQAAMLELPAGRIDKDEDPAAAALRELREEVQASGRIHKLSSVWVSPGWTDERQHFYYATDLVHDETAEQDKFENVKPIAISFSQLPDLMAAGVLVDSKSIAVLGAYRLLTGL